MAHNLVSLFCSNQQSQHTAKNAGYRLRAFASWLESEYKVTDLENVTVVHILSYKQYLAQSDLAPTSQARALETIRSFFRWCCEVGLIQSDPAKSVKSPRATLNKEPSYLEVSEVQQLFSVVNQSRHAQRDTALLWCLSVGLRAGEVVALDVQDVLMPSDGSKLARLHVHGKRSYDRDVPLQDAALDAIKAYLAERGNVKPTDPLFITRYGGDVRRMSKINLQKWFANLVQMAGLPKEKAHCHAARHGAAMRWTYGSKAPGGIYVVGKLLGHSHVSTTEKYLHCGPQGRAAMEQAILTDPLAITI